MGGQAKREPVYWAAHGEKMGDLGLAGLLEGKDIGDTAEVHFPEVRDKGGDVDQCGGGQGVLRCGGRPGSPDDEGVHARGVGSYEALWWVETTESSYLVSCWVKATP